ncbi:MAG: hypothetical protein HOP11_05145 [Saprospiraceae bacterium]|nr:hypothetical protein [Saprospiraceae bacterium]
MEIVDRILKNQWQSLSLIILVAVLLYFRSFSFGFALDDTIVYDENKFVAKGFKGIRDILSKESFTGYFDKQQDYVAGARYRPLSLVTFAIEHQIWGKKPELAHVINVIIYAFCGIVLYGFLRRITNSQKWAAVLALIGALLFIAHPIHTEAVANIKGRDEMMCMLFCLLTLNNILDYVDKNEKKYLIYGLLNYFLALMSKENAITFLAIIPLTLYFFKNLGFIESIRKTWMIWIPAILFLIIRSKVIGFFLNNGGVVTDLMNNPFVGMRLDEKISTIFYCIGWYIKLLFIPHPLTHDYYPYHVPKVGFDDAISWLGIIFILAILILSFLFREKNKLQWYSVLFFFITISIVANIVFPVGTFMNERFLFIPSIAFILVFIELINWVIKKLPQLTSVTYFCVGLIFLLYSVRTFTRVPDWMSGDSLNFSAIKVSENSARINLFTGVSYFKRAEVEAQPTAKKKLLDEATRYIDRSLYIFPTYGQALNMKAGILAEYHKMSGGTEDFLIHIVKVVEKEPNLKFVNDYLKYIAQDPSNKSLLYEFYSNTGYELFFKKQKRVDLAIQYLEEAYKLRRNEKLVLERLIEVYSIAPTLRGVTAKQVSEFKNRLDELKLFYQVILR